MPFRPWIFENDAEKVAIEKVPAVFFGWSDDSIRRYLERLKMEHYKDKEKQIMGRWIMPQE
jgi:hypothetical protein